MNFKPLFVLTFAVFFAVIGNVTGKLRHRTWLIHRNNQKFEH